MKKIGLVFVFSSLLFPLGFAWADTNDSTLQAMQSIRDVQSVRLESQILGRPFYLLIKEPAAARECESCTYPTVLLLDGGATFPVLAGYLNYLRFEEAVPDVLLIGISYAGDSFEEGNYRSTDYTAPSVERDYWGGAGNFQRVLEEEILPLVEERYAVDKEQRIIFGQSLGGQFVLYTALTRPDLFAGHISSNPALHRNLDFFLENRDVTGETRLFVAVGSNDSPRFKPFSSQWIEHWTSIERKPFELEAREVPGYGHFSLLPESFRQGLIWVLGE